MAYKVFISFGWHDRWIAKQFARLIGETGATPWISTSDIEIGDQIPKIVRKALRECDELVALMTPYSINRKWLTVELSGVWMMEKRFNLFFYGETLESLQKTHGGATFVTDQNVANLDDFDHYLEQLKRRVAASS